MIDEFKLPMEIIDRKVTKMKMISPSNREVDVGKTLNDREWIGMCRREVFDDYLRNRAKGFGANVSEFGPDSPSSAQTHPSPDHQIVNGLMMKLDVPKNPEDAITVYYNDYEGGAKVGTPKTMEVDLVIGADGANSRVAKDIDAGEYDYAIAFQERIRIS